MIINDVNSLMRMKTVSYTPLTYIESTGEQGTVFLINRTIEKPSYLVQFTYLARESWIGYFACGNGATGNAGYVQNNGTGSSIYCYCNGNTRTKVLTLNTTYTFEYRQAQGLYLDNAIIGNAITATTNADFFKIQNGKMRYLHVQIKENGVIIYDAYPAQRNDGANGLLDSISGSFVSSATSVNYVGA